MDFPEISGTINEFLVKKQRDLFVNNYHLALWRIKLQPAQRLERSSGETPND